MWKTCNLIKNQKFFLTEYSLKLVHFQKTLSKMMRKVHSFSNKQNNLHFKYAATHQFCSPNIFDVVYKKQVQGFDCGIQMLRNMKWKHKAAGLICFEMFGCHNQTWSKSLLACFTNCLFQSSPKLSHYCYALFVGCIILDILSATIHLLSLWGFFGGFKVCAKFMVVLLI